MHKASP
ncbi:hypothetical protein RDI58_021806 [Solanum bulbocastanum]